MFVIRVDKTAPSVALSVQSTPVAGYAVASPVLFYATFSESVTGFDSTDVVVTGSSSFTVTPPGTASTFTIAVTPSGQTTVTVSIAAGVCKDAATNDNTEAPSSVSVIYGTFLIEPNLKQSINNKHHSE